MIAVFLPLSKPIPSIIAHFLTRMFTESAQDAPVIHAGEEWAFLIGGRGSGVKHVFVHHNLLIDIPVNI